MQQELWPRHCKMCLTSPEIQILETHTLLEQVGFSSASVLRFPETDGEVNLNPIYIRKEETKKKIYRLNTG